MNSWSQTEISLQGHSHTSGDTLIDLTMSDGAKIRAFSVPAVSTAQHNARLRGAAEWSTQLLRRR